MIVQPSAQGGFIAYAPAEHQMHSYYATVIVDSFEDGLLVGHIDRAGEDVQFRVTMP